MQVSDAPAVRRVRERHRILCDVGVLVAFVGETAQRRREINPFVCVVDFSLLPFLVRHVSNRAVVADDLNEIDGDELVRLENDIVLHHFRILFHVQWIA